MYSEKAGESSTQPFDNYQEAAEHVLRWAELEYATYRTAATFSPETNQNNLQIGRLEPHSKWSKHLENSWARATIHQKYLNSQKDNLTARQQFGKFLNASRNLLETLIVLGFAIPLEDAHNNTHEILDIRSLTLNRDTAPFIDGEYFNPSQYYEVNIVPELEKARLILMGSLDSPITHNGTSDSVLAARYKGAAGPIDSIMCRSFEVISSLVYLDGVMPEPGHAAGDIRDWQEA